MHILRSMPCVRCTNIIQIGQTCDQQSCTVRRYAELLALAYNGTNYYGIASITPTQQKKSEL